MNYGTETKVFGEPNDFNPATYEQRRKNGIPRVAKAKREAVCGSPDLGMATTSHIERVFLTVRQEMTRFTRMTLGYSKDLRMHKLAVHLHFGLYNLVRRHKGLDGYTPAQAAGVEEKRWTLEDVVEMAEAYWQPKREEEAKAKAIARRAAEDAMFAMVLGDQ